MPAEIIDPFYRSLYARLTDNYNDRVKQLASGSAARISNDSQTVAEKYAAQISYIQAIEDVLRVCEEIERDRYGNVKPGDD